jgi:histidine ammonia-lyase
MVENTAQVIAIELLAACQGIDLRQPHETSPALQTVRAALRATTPFASQDRLMANDIARAAAVIRSEGVLALARDIVPSGRPGG